VPVPPRRIVLVGVTGSGKSTLAARIAESVRAPYVAMDDLYWRPGWVKVPKEERAARYADLAVGERWVADALPGAGRGALLERADLVLALDYPRWLSLQRLLRRTARRVRSGESICNGNRETVRELLSRRSIIVWHFQSFAEVRREIALLEATPTGPPVVRLTSQRATDAWLEDLRRSLS
jgi:adenylate kinase family enzyme